MAGLNSVASVAFAVSMGKLFFLHAGNQKPNQFDNHMLRTDAAPGKTNRVKLRRSYVELVVDAYRTAKKKAIALCKDRKISAHQKKLWDSHDEIAAVLKSGDSGKILKTKVNYDQVTEKTIALAELDMIANKVLLGM